MEHLFLISAVACLVVSWLYILHLKTKVRDCMTYIQNRIDSVTPGLDNLNRRAGAGHGSKGVVDPSPLCLEDATTLAIGRAAMDAKPKLIVGGSDSTQPLQYLCSHCSQPFYLPGDQPPKEAVAELLHSFRQHVEREHPDATSGSNSPARGGEIPDSD